MNLTIQIPDELAGDLVAAGGDLSRRALEGFGLEEYKSDRQSPPCAGCSGFQPATSSTDFSRHML
jgi:hypothetical protein